MRFSTSFHSFFVFMARYGAAALVLLFLTLLLILPLSAMMNLDDTQWLWSEILHDDYHRQRILWTIFQAAFSVLLTTIIAIPIAWALAHYQFFARKWVLRLLMLPFIMPTLVAAMGILALFGESGFLWQGWQDTPYLLLYGNVFFNLPVMIRAAYQGLNQVPANRLAAARVLGASAWQQFWQVQLPQMKAWLAGGACLVFLYCFSGFGLALILGGHRYATVEVEIYQLIAYELDMARAAVLVWFVLLITAASALLYTLFSRHAIASTVQHKLPEKPQSYVQKLFLGMVLTLLGLCCVLPLLAIIVRAMLAFSAWPVLLEEETLTAIFNTLRFTFSAVLLSALLGLAHAAAARQFAWVRTLAFLPFMVSPVCLAFGVLLLYPEYTDHSLLLISLYTLSAYPFVTKDVLAAWDALPNRYIAAARILGASPFQTMHCVVLPLLRPALRRGLTLAAATGIGEFAATLFLSRPEWTTLTTLIYTYFGRVGVENNEKAMVLTFVLLLLSIGIFMLLDEPEK